MGLRKGLKKVKEAKDRFRGGDGPRRLSLRDGESVVLRFFGDFEDEEEGDPPIALRHYVKRFENQKGVSAYQWCNENCDQPCCFCFQKERGDKGISLSDIANFFVWDTRKFHKFEEKQRVLRPGVKVRPGKALKPDDYFETKYPMCVAGKRPCPYCKQGNEAKEAGFKWFPLACMFANAAVELQDVARDYCKCGARDDNGEGTIVVVNYLCSNCNTEVSFQPELGVPVAACGGCGQTLPPLEEIECSACDEPYRSDLQDWYVRASRTGGGTDTMYNFELIPPCRPCTDEELDAAEKEWPDWEKITSGDPVELQAANLGIMNPFGATPGHGSTSYAGANGNGRTTPEQEQSYAEGIDYTQGTDKPAFSPPKRKLKIKLRR